MGTREENRLARRAEIVAAARKLMRQSTDLGFSMRTLAERAGVSIATPYNLFGSKQAILVAVLDKDLDDYRHALAQLRADGIDSLFEAVALMADMLEREPEFYRTVLTEVFRDHGGELSTLVGGPRYLLWKRIFGEATDKGLIREPGRSDAFAVTLSQLNFGTIQAWALGLMGTAEMRARLRYGMALALLGIATAGSRAAVEKHLGEAQLELEAIWRAGLQERLQSGQLDPATRERLGEQLRQMETIVLEEKTA